MLLGKQPILRQFAGLENDGLCCEELERGRLGFTYTRCPWPWLRDDSMSCHCSNERYDRYHIIEREVHLRFCFLRFWLNVSQHAVFVQSKNEGISIPFHLFAAIRVLEAHICCVN